MDQETVTLLTGLISAIVGGGIGLASAILSYRMAQQQLNRQAEESSRTRDHEALLLSRTKRLEAIETLWKHLYDLERGLKYNDENIDSFVRAVMWLPEVARGQSLRILKQHLEGNARGVLSDELKALRERLICATGIERLE